MMNTVRQYQNHYKQKTNYGKVHAYFPGRHQTGCIA